MTLQNAWKTHGLYAISFVNGAVIMVFELIGARIIAPFLGSSTFVWTSIIGVILLALSVGYYYGGVLADKGASRKKLAQILLLAGLAILVSRIIRDDFLIAISSQGVDVRVKSFLAALVLFSPASFLMGMVSPYIGRLQLESIKEAGKTIGSLYAAGTAGSIVGTFAYGYWLVAAFPNGAVHAALAAIMIILSVAVSTGWRKPKHLAVAVGLVAVSALLMFANLQGTNLELDRDTQYSRVIVNRTTLDNRPVRLYFTEAGRSQSGVYLDGDRGSAFTYVQKIAAYAKQQPGVRVLMIGGGTFTLAKDIARQDAAAHIDVIEIDPALTDIAQEFFFYQPSEQITIYNQDGREFLNNANYAQYDIIVIDAYTVNGPPFQLATTEAVAHMRRLLKPDGVVIANLIASYEGENARLLDAIDATYRTAFTTIKMVSASNAEQPKSALQNILLYAGSQESRYPEVVANNRPRPTMQPLTDDFAPIEYYTAKAIQ